MKKILIFITIIFAFYSCDKLESLNENKKDFTTVPGEAIFNGTTRAFTNLVLTCNVNRNNTMLFAQMLASTTYPDESRYDMVTRTIPENNMNTVYRTVLMNLKDAKRVLSEQSIIKDGITQQQRNNQLAEVEIFSVFAWSYVFETFGAMPYSEALDYDKYPTPVYDDALTCYKNLLVRLDDAIAALDVNAAGMGKYDNLFGGDKASTTKWKAFAYSLKLRMGLMLADIEPTLAKTMVEDAFPKSFASGGKCAQAYLSASPNTHPLYAELVLTGRYDFVPANTFVNVMNDLNDPRRDVYFTQIDTSSEDGVEKLAYVGGKYGFSNGYDNFSHINPSIVTATREGLLMDYSEVEFLRAEAIERGFIAGSAKEHYDNAIKASFAYWGISSVEANAYLAQPTVDYATVTAGGNWKKAIGEQAWIAYYFRGVTAWTSWRRLDYPRLVAPSSHVTEVNGIPYRYIYPISEQTLNGVNYAAAVASFCNGNDNAMTPLFWDIKHYNTLTGNDL